MALQHSESFWLINGQKTIAAEINNVSHIAFTKAFPTFSNVSNKAKNPHVAIAEIKQPPKQFLHI